MGNILKFPKEQAPFLEVLDDLRRLYNEKRIEAVLVGASIRYKEGEESEDYKSMIRKFWVGESCLELLGLADIVKDDVMCFMREESDEKDVGEDY